MSLAKCEAGPGWSITSDLKIYRVGQPRAARAEPESIVVQTAKPHQSDQNYIQCAGLENK